MPDWKKRGKKSDEVIYFPYIAETIAQKAPEVYLWDVDRTYLDTKLETVRGLWKTATEKANQKKNIPGTGELVRSLKDSWEEKNKGLTFPIFFITASPPQLEERILQKLKLDGVEPMGIFCKDNFTNLRPKKFWRITKHVSYKLQALLQLRAFLREDVKLIMFGDDGESDSIIYSLFSDICARRFDSAELRKVLNHYSVLDDQVNTIFEYQKLVPNNDPVSKVYINLADDTDSEYYLKFGRRILPTYNSFQATLDLYQDGRIDTKHVVNVAKVLIERYDYTREEVQIALDDLIRRERMSSEFTEKIIPILKKELVILEDFEPSVRPKSIANKEGSAVISLEGSYEDWVPERIDYFNDYR